MTAPTTAGDPDTSAPERAATALGALLPGLPLLVLASAFLFGCDSGGMECLGSAVVGGVLLVAAAPTVLLLVGFAPAIPAWAVVTVAAVTSAPLWWLAARAVVRRVSRRGRWSWTRWALWWGFATTGWAVAAIVFSAAIVAALGRMG